MSFPAIAGDLNPPIGPVAPTQRTPINANTTPGDADSLFQITQPGSYYLSGNITGVVGKHGIEIAASGVTIDLNGFELVGVPGMGLFDGISTQVASLIDIQIHSGSVRHWGDEGVDVGSVNSIGAIVTDIRASGNGSHGIRGGSNTTVKGCLASVNGGFGILSGISGAVVECTAISNSGGGISIAAGSTMTGCVAGENVGTGISAGAGCTILACTSHTNTGDGISFGSGSSTISGCSAFQNSLNGIITSSGCAITDCIAATNLGAGIATGSGCTITACSATGNGANGITSSSSTIINCAVRINALDGIRVSTGCLVQGNTCTANGISALGAGIHATGGDNRIEDNNCTGADIGIDVDLGGNIIVRNTCSGNTTNNWDISASNVCLVVTATTAPAFTGNAGGTAPGSTDPSANYTY